MNAHQPVDWLSSSTDERAVLYRVLRAIAETSGQTIEALMEQALGGPLLTGADYLSNVRKGKISRAKAQLIHAWIALHHPEVAHTIAPQLFPETTAALRTQDMRKPARSEVGRLLPDDIPDPILEPYAFTRYVDEHAIEGPLRIISLAPRKGLVQRADEKRRKPTQTLKLGEPFCFELDSPCEGTAIMLQGYQGRWHPVGIEENAQKRTIKVKMGISLIPDSGKEQEYTPLLEETDQGFHTFSLINCFIKKKQTPKPHPHCKCFYWLQSSLREIMTNSKIYITNIGRSHWSNGQRR